MKNINKDKLISLILLIIGVIGLSFSIISNENRYKAEDKKYQESQKVNKEQFAMYIETEYNSGNYEEYSGHDFPDNYILNTDNSQCVDINNNLVDDALSTDNNGVTIKSQKTVFCYLYFDLTEEQKYTVSLTSSNTSYGTIAESAQTVSYGNSVSFTLSPSSGYVYKSNTCGGTVSGNTLTISNVTGNISCTVNFGTSLVVTKYTVSVSSNNTSYGNVSPASQTVISGGTAKITLIPTSGYQYSSNTCGGTVSGTTLTISNVTSNITCTVAFLKSGTTVSPV